MSKLIEKLQWLSEEATQPMGFRAVVSEPRSPSMILIAGIEGPESAKLAAQEGADGILVYMGDLRGEAQNLSQIAGALGDIPWGASLERMGDGELSQLLEMGCDFLVFDATNAPSRVLWEERIGRVLKIEPSLSDSLVFTISQLPIDAVLIGGGVEEGSTITVGWVMACQRLVNLVRKPIIALASPNLADRDLKTLHQAGVAGVVVRLGNDFQGGSLSKIRQAIESLPPRVRRRGVGVLLPYHREIQIPGEVEEI